MRKRFLLVIAPLIIALLVVYVASLDANTIKTPWGKITAQQGEGEDEVEVVVFENGKRPDRDYFFAVIGPDGELKMGRAEKGQGKASLGSYHAALARMAKELGYNPSDVELGVIVEIGRFVDLNETHIAAERMVVSAPLKPGKPNKVKIEVEFKPHARSVVPKPKNATGGARAAGVQASSSPPSVIEKGCPPPEMRSPFTLPSYACYEWRLFTSQKSPDTIIPTMIVYLGANDVYNAKDVSATSQLKVSSETGLKLTLPLGAILSKEGKAYLLTQGFSITLSTATTLMDANCIFRSNKETPYYSECVDYLRNSRVTLPTYDSSSAVGAWGAVGVRGVYWYVQYDVYYVAYVYDWNLRRYVIAYQAYVDTAYGFWSTPYAEQVSSGVYRFWPEFRINTNEIGNVVMYYNTPEWYGGPPKYTITSGTGSNIYISANHIVSSAKTQFSTTPFTVSAALIACGVTGGTLCNVLATVATSFDVSYETSTYIQSIGIVSADLRCAVPFESRGFTLKNYVEQMGTDVYLPVLFVHLRTTARC
ncbi:MAG: hypothetical protein QXP31_05530 [Pyrobaculum sp.]